ncbi:MAG: redoxin domain-containing protein [Prolixibacteraceae bacterium]|nr:redoxin domain-containing protein [Prolixibacteraceae bacterium]
MRFLQFLFLFVLVFQTFGAEVKITATQPEYAGRKLDFYYHEDPVTLKSVFAFSLNFDQSGNASITVNINETTCFYSDFGIYKGAVFIEPGKNINLKMPPLREKSFADQKNPYFEPITFWFNATQNNNVNNQISAFTLQLNSYTDQHFEQLYFQRSKVIYDSLVYFLDEKFSKIESPAFKLYSDLSLKIIQADVFRLKPENYASHISNIPSVDWGNPAFEDLLEKIFNAQLSTFAKTIAGEDVRNAVNRADLNFLNNWVKSHFKLTGETTQLAVLKLLYDGYFSNEFSKDAIEKMVLSSPFKNSGNKLIQKTAENIYQKFTFLKQGTTAPTICLTDLNGEQICTNKNNDKYKYLIFADLEMIVCREHLKYLATIDEQFQKYLEIYTVFLNNDEEKIKKFIAENPVPGKLLIDKNEEITKIFVIRSFPQSFLLDKNHTIVFEAAKSPLDGFEQQFSTYLRNELFEQQRNQSK